MKVARPFTLLVGVTFFRIRDGLRHILNISHIGNGYIQANQPWELVKGSPDEKYENT